MNTIKIQSITAENIKAISHFVAVFEGKSAHVTGKNGYGKSTLIRVLIDRLRGLSPSIITKIGESEGQYVMELTNGGRFVWEFNLDGKEKLNYFTKDSLTPVKRDVFKALVSRYFPNQFDVNLFLKTTQPRERLRMISELIKVDLTDVQERYKNAFNARAEAKKILKNIKAQDVPRPSVYNFSNLEKFCEVEQNEVEKIELEITKQRERIELERSVLNDIYLKNKLANDQLAAEAEKIYQNKLRNFEKLEKSRKFWIDKYNAINNLRIKKNDSIQFYISRLTNLISEIELQFIDFASNSVYLENLKSYQTSQPQPRASKDFVSNPVPDKEQIILPDPMPDSNDIERLNRELSVLDSKLALAKAVLKEKESEKSKLLASKHLYDLQVTTYKQHLQKVDDYEAIVLEHENNVLSILNEIKEIVRAAKLPDEFQIDLTNKNDILFRPNSDSEYLPITTETLASSAIYIAAFKLDLFYTDVFRVVHFDVSYLDYENRISILNEAKKLDIQLLTESPASSESEKYLQYTITE